MAVICVWHSSFPPSLFLPWHHSATDCFVEAVWEDSQQQQKKYYHRWLLLTLSLMFSHISNSCSALGRTSFSNYFLSPLQNKPCVPRYQGFLQEKRSRLLQKMGGCHPCCKLPLCCSLPPLFPGHSALRPLPLNRWTGQAATLPTFAVWRSRFFRLPLQNPKD